MKNKICLNKEHLKKNLKIITDQEGEGLMLKDPNSYYENKRTSSLLKVKVFHDAEAKIIGHIKGTGKFTRMLGAYQCEDLKTKVVFKVGSGLTDLQRKNPLKIGTIITY